MTQACKSAARFVPARSFWSIFAALTALRAGAESTLIGGVGLAMVAALLFGAMPICGQTATPPTAATDFGSAAVGTAAAQAAVTFTVGSGGALGTPLVLTQGTGNLDFKLGSGSTCTGSVSGSSCTVNVVFKPLAPGLRRGAVQLTNSTGGVIATAFIFGNGVGPRVVFTPGVISTVAGTGPPCSSLARNSTCGDGGPATGAHFESIAGITVDAAGNVFLADRYDSRIRKIDALTGLISSVAGVHEVFCDASLNPGCLDGGPATQGLLSVPTGVAIDGAGNLYIADSRDKAIRKVTASTGMISTVASGQPYPWGITVDRAGDVYFSDISDNVVRKLTVATGVVTTVAGNGTSAFAGDGGLATSASLQLPYSVAVDAAGNLYIADSGSDRIRKVSAATGIITTIAGSGAEGYSGDGGAATNAALYGPRGIVEDGGGNLYFADVSNDAIRKVDAAGIITTVAGGTVALNGTTGGYAGYTGDGGPAVGALINLPNGVALDSAGNLFIADTANYVVRKVTATPADQSFASTPVGSTSTDSPRTVTVSNTGTAPLNFAVPTSGINPAITAGYTLASSSTCPQISASGNASVLAAGASCTEVISFHPVAVSATNAGSLTLTDNSLNVAGTTQFVALSGVSTASTGIVTPTLTLTVPTTAATGAMVGGTAAFTSSSTSAPTGNVTIYAVASGSTTPITLATVAATGAAGGSGAAFSFAAPTTPGTYSIYASYAGDTNFNSANSSSASLVVSSAALTATTTNLSAVSTVVVGTAFPVTVRLGNSNSSATPTGIVTLTATPAGGSPATVANLTAAQALTFGGYVVQTTLPTPGLYTLTASYAGDTNFATSTASLTITVTVTSAAPAATQLQISAVSNPDTTTNIHPNIKLTSTTLPQVLPTGNVRLTVTPGCLNLTTDPTAAQVFNTTYSGSAADYVLCPTAGPAALTVSYAGDANYGPSTASIGINVQKADLALSIVDPGPQVSGIPFRLALKTSPISQSATGSITVSAQLIGSQAAPVTANIASSRANISPFVDFTLPSVGTYSITASYPGDANDLASTAAPISVNVVSPANGAPGFGFVLSDAALAANNNTVRLDPDLFGLTPPVAVSATLIATGSFNSPVLLSSNVPVGSNIHGITVTFRDPATGKFITSSTPVTSGTKIEIVLTETAMSGYGARLEAPRDRRSVYLAGILLGAALLGFRKRNYRVRRALTLLCFVWVIVAAGSALSGCSDPKNRIVIPITVTATPSTGSQSVPSQSVTFQLETIDI